ncbi:SusC/RagA family TonB-linked outer membrane protein [Chitinophaga silvisoli]|uniref:TonB-dependent receptor n=1 Tax=Chitinophaga silvisoli TaxID=2291814 RepID=A0A3E1NZP0_9BACT|nr:TonB-dependent receptor [Chitinophaga silvisoli]RFM33417.1 TonB-dependent receptor [Chitinophaga silvisoli]
MTRRAYLLLILLTCHVLGFANELRSQITVQVRDTRINLDVKNTPLRKVFLLIESQTGLSIAYNATHVADNQLISYKATAAQLSTVLQDLLKGYEGAVKQVDDNHILLKVEKIKAAPLVEAPATAPVTITGVVTDENNQPIPGVSIHEKTSKVNTTTDANGQYSIRVNIGDVLVFNFIGFAPQEITVTSANMLNVRLKAQNSQLQEVVAIGYQSVRKSDLTGAVSSVKSSEMNLTAPTVGQAIVGKVAGVQVSQVSGAPYKSTKIRVRGIGSFNASSDPLYVVDGYPVDNDVFINPEDIETIDILKDAASAAIYGSRASGGVVMITTKRGKAGTKGKLEYSYTTGINQVSKKVKLLDSNQFLQLLVDGRNGTYRDLVENNTSLTWNDNMMSDNNATRVARVGNANAVQIDPRYYDFANQKVIPSKYNTDWQDLIYRNAFFGRHNVSFSGGTDNIRYYMSGGYQDQDGVVLNTGVKKINLRMNLDATINPRLKAGVNLSYTNNQNRELSEGRWDHNPIMTALLMPPSAQPFDSNGHPLKNEIAALSATYGYNSFENPIAQAKEINITRKGNRSNYNAYAIYTLLPELTFKANVGMMSYSEKYNYYYPTSLSSGVSAPYSDNAKAAANGIAQNQTVLDQLAEFTLNYNKRFGKHSISGLAGYSAQMNTTDLVKVTAKGFEDDRIQEITAKGADGTDFQLTNAYKSTYTLMSYFGRVSYNYADRYYVTGSLRTDGSSRFGPQNKWGLFPSVSAGWNISNESFYHDWLGQQSTLKLRASWGLSGNNNIGNYNTMQTMATATGTVFGSGTVSTAYYPGDLKDQKLGWESTSQFNTGLDVGLLKGRLNIIANYYLSYSYNLLFKQSISGISGSTEILTNLRDSKIRNSGVDLQVDARIIDGKDFHMGVNGNISINRNKVLDMGGGSTIITAGAERSYKTHITQEGQPVGMFYGFQVERIARPDDIGKVAQSSASSTKMRAGDLIFRDTNKDGVVNDADKAVIGSPYAKFTYGFGLNASYKNFSFASSFNGSYGNKVLDGQDYYLYNMEGSGNQYADAAGHYVSEANPGNGHVFRASRSGTQSNSTRLSTFYLQSGSFFRCTNATLGYDIRSTLLKNRLGLSSARVFASVDNLFTISKYKGYNPEVDFNNGNNLAPGVDYGMYPLVRAYNVGVKVGF